MCLLCWQRFGLRRRDHTSYKVPHSCPTILSKKTAKNNSPDTKEAALKKAIVGSNPLRLSVSSNLPSSDPSLFSPFPYSPSQDISSARDLLIRFSATVTLSVHCHSLDLSLPSINFSEDPNSFEQETRTTLTSKLDLFDSFQGKFTAKFHGGCIAWHAEPFSNEEAF